MSQVAEQHTVITKTRNVRERSQEKEEQQLADSKEAGCKVLHAALQQGGGSRR